MDADRRIALWTLVVERACGDAVTVGHVGAVAMVAAGVDGISVTLAVSQVARQTVYASDDIASELAELTLALGEGPDVDAFADGGPVLAADLAAPEYLARWPMFAPAAAGEGARAVLALPLRIGGIRLGVLTMYRASPGGLHGAHLADALELTDTACLVLLDRADREGSRPADGQPPGTGLNAQVHQASGMVSVQLGVSVEVALVRLRAHAYARSGRLRDIASDVVARRLRFDPESGDAR